MTPQQFDAIAQLIRTQDGPVRAAARLVLVDGIAPSVAADSNGISRQSMSNALRSYKAAADLIESAWPA